MNISGGVVEGFGGGQNQGQGPGPAQKANGRKGKFSKATCKVLNVAGQLVTLGGLLAWGATPNELTTLNALGLAALDSGPPGWVASALVLTGALILGLQDAGCS